MGELGKRITVGAICIPLFILITLIGKIPFLILINITMLMALWEFYTLAERKGFYSSKLLGGIAIVVIGGGLYFNYENIMAYTLLMIFILMIIYELFKGEKHSLVNVSVTLFGVIYISLFSSFILIREIPLLINRPYSKGGLIIMLIFFTIWICDTGAYFFGSRFGKHSLYKRISPKKTWEGAIGGFIISVVSAIGISKLISTKLLLVDVLLIGIIIGTLGQISDLAESMFKRYAGVKDSSSILPGHGGILDRFDSPLLVGPTIYLYLLLRGFPL